MRTAFAGAAGAGSSLAAARPGGYRDGAEDATTVPSAAIATTAVTAGIALRELPGVALRGGVHLGLQLGAVHQRGYLEAEHERLDQHHDGERDENVGRDQPAR